MQRRDSGADRHRGDVGDLDGLAESLRELGQLQPIVVTSDLRLIAGGRRLAAVQSLGWVEIEALPTRAANTVVRWASIESRLRWQIGRAWRNMRRASSI
jgi:ParB-like chromosome segregation protein Spo0J